MEVLNHPEYWTLFCAMLAMAFTQSQKDWFKRRDGGKCQLPGFQGIRCDNKHPEIDHVIPQRFARDTLGMSEDEINSAENGLTLCMNHHRGHPKSKHPDAFQALTDYRNGNKNAFKQLFGVRDQELDDGEDYWNKDYDAAESALVVRNNRRYAQQHPEDPFPTHTKRVK